jgi:hypothetical protein
MKRQKIFLSSLVVVFCLGLLGVWGLFFAGKMNILADIVGTSNQSTTASTVALQKLHYTATVDGNATIQFSGNIATVLSADYQGVSGTSVSGDLTGCAAVALAGDTTGRVALVSSVSPFKVRIYDNGTGTPPPYNFDLFCTSPLPSGIDTSAVLKTLHYTATVDGNATIQFSSSSDTIVSSDYQGVTNNKVTGDLTGCSSVALANDTTGRVFLTSSVSPFTIKIADNGAGTPPPYNFDLFCTDALTAKAISGSNTTTTPTATTNSPVAATATTTPATSGLVSTGISVIMLLIISIALIAAIAYILALIKEK